MQGVRFRTDLLYMYGRLRGLWHCWRPATFRNSCWRHQCPCARLKHGDWVDLLHSYQYVHAGLLQSLGGAGAIVGWRARFVSGSTAATATSRHSIDDGEYCTWSGSRELGLPRAPSNCQHVRHSRHDLRPATSIVCRRHCLRPVRRSCAAASMHAPICERTMRSVQLRKVIFQFGTPSMLWCALVADSTWALAERRGHIPWSLPHPSGRPPICAAPCCHPRGKQ